MSVRFPTALGVQALILDADSDFNFLMSTRGTELNPLGAEWKNQVQFGRTSCVFSEWYQPSNTTGHSSSRRSGSFSRISSKTLTFLGMPVRG